MDEEGGGIWQGKGEKEELTRTRMDGNRVNAGYYFTLHPGGLSIFFFHSLY